MLNIFRYIIIGLSIYSILGMVFKENYLLKTTVISQKYTQPLTNLQDGHYQFCSQPEPKDWLVGAGVCMNFSKIANTIKGYYGYPHSDNFICITGQLKAQQIIGQAFAIASTEKTSQDIPQSAFKWDREGNLTLETGTLLTPTTNPSPDTDIFMDIQWIRFEKALLDIHNFYRYTQPRMTPVSQLCPWSQFFTSKSSLSVKKPVITTIFR